MPVLFAAAVLIAAGCGTGGAKKESVTGASSVTGTWQTASMGYQDDDMIQPEYYVQFTDSSINYGHMENGEFVLDHSDEIRLFENTETGGYLIQAESLNGTQYTYRTGEEDADILEYYETWDEADFPEMYRGGASLSRSGIQ